jgi:transcriptional regulator with XRE-family HTH domain
MDLGSRIRTKRKEAGLSQEALARRAGMSLNGFTDIERGVATNPHYSTLKKIANALGMTPERLIAEPVDSGKARVAASRASKAAADAKKWAREFGREAIEAQFKDLISRALEEREAGNETQARLYADKATLLQRGTAEHADRLTKARFAVLSHTGTMAGSPEVEELRVEAQEFEELLERLNEVVREVAPWEVSEEESAAMRDAAQQDSA